MKNFLIALFALASLTAHAGWPPISSSNDFITALPGEVIRCNTVSAIQNGCLTSTDYSALMGTTGVTPGSYLFSNLTVNARGQITSASNGSLPSPGVYYVDNSRTDSFTPDGSMFYPYAAIQTAVNALAASGPSVFGTIIVNSAGSPYVENVTFNSSHLFAVTLKTNSSAVIAPVSGYSIASTSNNTQLNTVEIEGFGLPGGVNFAGDTDGTNFVITDLHLENCAIGATSVFTNLGQTNIINTEVQGNIPFINVNGATVRGGRVFQGTVSVTSDYGANKPSGFGGTSLFAENVLITGGNLTIDNTSYVQFRRGTRFGSPGGTLEIQSGGEIEVYDSFIRSNIINDTGGTYTNHSGFHQGTFTNNGTYTNQQTADQIAYDPTTSANWASVPTQVLSALDTLAASGIAKASGQIKGSDGTADAAAGNVGEYIESVVSVAANYGGTAVFTDVASITLTAGDWDITALIGSMLNGATMQSAVVGISPISGNTIGAMIEGSNLLYGGVPTAAMNSSGTIPAYRVKIASTTTFYLKAYSVYSAGTPKYVGRLSARRVR